MSLLNQTAFTNAPQFIQIETLQNGKFGQVMIVEHASTRTSHVMKVLSKYDKNNKRVLETLHLQRELRLLKILQHPFIVRMDFCLETDSIIMLVMEYCSRSDIFSYLARGGRFDEDAARFYLAEIVTAIEYIHSQDIIHRDIKPENILLDHDGHIKLCDFGLAKQGEFTAFTGAITNCGTKTYMTPEMFTKSGYGYSVDWWMLGMTAFEMFMGVPAHNVVENKNLSDHHHDWINSVEFLNQESKYFISALLEKQPTNRLGSTGASEVKNHPFFEGINWDDLFELNFEPPINPHIGFEVLDETSTH